MSSSVSPACIIELRGDEVEPSATPTDIGVFPVPMEPGINLTVVAGDPSNIKEHPTDARGTEKQENSDRVTQSCSGLRMIENAD